ncbi:MAG: class GN sortase [Acidiferrobacterales bacterium]|nr:class GN sortase [Acidiferrobacterales bacterium]
MSRFILIGLWSLGILLLSKGFYMDVKANVAQVLISSSWDRRTEDRPPPKPWWWADTRPIAKLEVPRLQQTLFVMQDDSGESLAFGPGHLPQSAKPNELGHVIIAGHRDSHFAFLKDIAIGDVIKTSNYQVEPKSYQVTEIYIIDSSQEQLNLIDDDQLTLITCYPFDDFLPGGPLRMIVHAEPLSRY